MDGKFREGVKRFEVELTEEVHEIFVNRAKKNKRSLKAEVAYTLEKSAGAPKKSLKARTPGLDG